MYTSQYLVGYMHWWVSAKDKHIHHSKKADLGGREPHKTVNVRRHFNVNYKTHPRFIPSSRCSRHTRLVLLESLLYIKAPRVILESIWENGLPKKVIMSVGVFDDP